MSSDVVLSAALRSNLLSLQGTQRSIDSTQLRLATGLKVNSALDNPQSFFTAQSLNNRASDLKRLLDGVALSVRTIEEADKGVTALTSLVEQAQSIAQEAKSNLEAASGFATVASTKDLSGVTDLVDPSTPLNTTSTSTFSIKVYRDSTGTALTAQDIAIGASDTIYDVAGTINQNTTLNPTIRASVDGNGHLVIKSLEEGNIIRIGAGSSNSVTSAGFAYLGLDHVVQTELSGAAGATRQGGTLVASHTIYSRQAASTALVNGEYQASAQLGASGANFASSFGGTNDTFGVSINIDGVVTQIAAASVYQDTTTVQKVIDDINGAGLNVTASFDSTTGKIGLTFDDSVSQAGLIFTSGSSGVGALNFGFGTRTSDQATTVAANVYSEYFTFSGNAADVAQSVADYNKVRTQIDDLVGDANYRGVNLLGGDTLTTYFNEDRTSTLDTVGADFTASGLGISSANFSTTARIDTAISELDDALSSIRAFGSSIANDLAIIQSRQDFTSNTINTLKAGASDLTAADQNEEGANLLALQTRQQLGVTSLALAAQSQQSVLRLF